jgi:hypothetical protein
VVEVASLGEFEADELPALSAAGQPFEDALQVSPTARRAGDEAASYRAVADRADRVTARLPDANPDHGAASDAGLVLADAFDLCPDVMILPAGSKSAA